MSPQALARAACVGVLGPHVVERTKETKDRHKQAKSASSERSHTEGSSAMPVGLYRSQHQEEAHEDEHAPCNRMGGGPPVLILARSRFPQGGRIGLLGKFRCVHGRRLRIRYAPHELRLNLGNPEGQGTSDAREVRFDPVPAFKGGKMATHAPKMANDLLFAGHAREIRCAHTKVIAPGRATG